MSNLRWWAALTVLLLAGAITNGFSRRESFIADPRLSDIPLSLPGWTAQDIPIDPHLVAVAHVDEYLNRIYQQPSGTEVGLYIGYYKSQRAGDSVHSPKNCLPGAGWQPISASRTQLPLASSVPAEANLYVVENGPQRYVVLYWYQSHGRIIASEYRAKLYTVRDALLLNRTDTALVRIAVPVTSDESEARKTAIDFATLISPSLNAVIPQ